MGASRTFSANTQVISCGSPTILDNIWDSGGTLAAWTYPTNLVGLKRIFAKSDGSSGWIFYYVDGGTPGLNFYHYFSGDDYRGRIVGLPSTDSWYHVAMTYNSSSSANRATFYFNGVSDAGSTVISPSGTRNSDAGNTFTLGNTQGLTGAFTGQICYFQAWDRILSASEINEAMIRPGSIRTNLVGYWPCLGSDSPERDLSGNGNSGTVTGATESFNGPPVRLF